MKDRKLAARYARALLSALPDAGQAEAADRFLGALAGVIERSAELRGVLMDPAYPRSLRKNVLADLAGEYQAPQMMRNFLAAVVDHNRVAALPAIASVYRELREEGAGIVRAEITTAAPITDELEQRARAALERRTGRTVRLSCRIEPELLGGAVTRIGSEVYDGSLKTQLEELKRRLVQE